MQARLKIMRADIDLRVATKLPQLNCTENQKGDREQ
jgi:hypothetical protein